MWDVDFVGVDVACVKLERVTCTYIYLSVSWLEFNVVFLCSNDTVLSIVLMSVPKAKKLADSNRTETGSQMNRLLTNEVSAVYLINYWSYKEMDDKST